MSDSHSLRPFVHLYPLRAELDDHQGDVSLGADVEEVAEMEHAMPRDAIVGTTEWCMTTSLVQGLYLRGHCHLQRE